MVDGRLPATFMAERLRHQVLAETFDRQFVSEKRTQLRAMARAVDRGDLPERIVRRVLPPSRWPIPSQTGPAPSRQSPGLATEPEGLMVLSSYGDEAVSDGASGATTSGCR